MSRILFWEFESAPAVNQGNLSVNLDAVTVSASGTVAIAGSVSKVLEDVTPTASGTVSLSGLVNAQLADCTSIATGAVAVTGSSDIALADVALTADGSGQIITFGSLSQSVDDVTVSADGIVTEAEAHGGRPEEEKPARIGRAYPRGIAAKPGVGAVRVIIEEAEREIKEHVGIPGIAVVSGVSAMSDVGIPKVFGERDLRIAFDDYGLLGIMDPGDLAMFNNWRPGR